MKNLIKRKNLDYNIKDGWYCEIKKGSSPNGSKAEVGEEIYIAQNGYAIFAKGVISEKKIIKVNGLAEFVKYSAGGPEGTKVKDDVYWYSKIKDFAKEKEPYKICILEYYIKDTELFENTIPLEEQFLKQTVWYYLHDDFKFKIPKNNKELTKHIPTKVRNEVFDKFKINLKEFSVDIDHFVPSKHGGPGNIFENLIPIGPSINRSKGDSIPSKLYDLGKKFNIKIPAHIKIDPIKYYNGAKEKKEARKIIEKINAQSLDAIRSDYKLIRDYHFPSIKNIQ
ncbi:MAG: hypothetical protein MK207_07450 [Saprospiraceae bacterium]|nr:hypothetical protein [Saprospiraceae bacterium]